jgi:hypothetical protein
MITAAVEADQQRDIMTADMPNAFAQNDLVSDNGERLIMKIKGQLTDMFTQMDSETYADYVVQEDNLNVLYVELRKSSYGMLQASLLFYKKLRQDLEEIGFKVNSYTPCVANRLVREKLHTITWHVNNIKSSHEDPRVNDNFLKWLEKKYGIKELGSDKTTRGKKHQYLRMMFNYTTPKTLKLDMKEYVKKNG